MTAGEILVVCTGNICRSPVAAGLLTPRLRGTGISVSSAGTHAVIGSPPTPEAIGFVRGLDGIDLSWSAVQLTKHAAESADLILTMTLGHRSHVTQLAPRSVRRTYTMIEFARITGLLEEDRRFETLEAFVEACAPLRRRAHTEIPSAEIPDPYGGPPGGYTESFTMVARAVDLAAAALSGKIGTAGR